MTPPPASPGDDDALPASLAQIAARVDHRLAQFLASEADRWRSLDEALGPPVDALRDLVLAGGKRLRPAFCHWGFVAAGGDPSDPTIVDAGAAFELLHAFALIHDDVVDDSSVRRGRSTIHVEFEDEHESSSYRGEPRRFGEGVAILIGDLAHVYADVLLDGVSPTALSLWNELRIELNMGQYLDVVGTARADADASRAWRIARYKSAKYTIERPLHLGASIAGGQSAFDELAPHLSAYGVPLGEAFQLRDDVLGAFGDSERTGKPVGDDLREGKPTPLLVSARERSDRRARPLLERVGDPDLTDDEIERLQKLFVECGALDEIEQAISRLREEALLALGEAPVTPAVDDALRALAWFVTVREA